jgi:competence protein ComEA
MFIVSHSFQFFRKISFGYNLKYLSLAIATLGSSSAFSMDMGCVAKYSDRLRFGFFFRNMIPPVIAGKSDNVSRGGEIGLAFTPVSGLLFSLTAAKHTGYGLYFKVGQELRLWNVLSLRSGFNTDTARFSAGLGLAWRFLRFDYAFVFQDSLGDQSVFSLSFDLSESKRSAWREEPRKSGARLTLDDLGPEKEYVGEKININTATLDELQAIPRVGPSTARSILEFRDRNGPFLRKEDLMKVPRIGIKTFARLREFITVGTVSETNGRVILREETEGTETIDTVTLKRLIDLGLQPMTAVKIVNFREAKGRIPSLDAVRTIEGMTDEEFRTVAPLLKPLFDRRDAAPRDTAPRDASQPDGDTEETR